MAPTYLSVHSEMEAAVINFITYTCASPTCHHVLCEKGLLQIHVMLTEVPKQ